LYFPVYNLDKSAARFCYRVAAWVQICFETFIFQSHKITNNLVTTEARRKISTVLEYLKFKKYFGGCLT